MLWLFKARYTPKQAVQEEIDMQNVSSTAPYSATPIKTNTTGQ